MIRWSFALCAAAALIAGTSAVAAEVVSTSFDSSLDGWTATCPSCITWLEAGGNPGGYLYFDETWGPGDTTWAIAPPKFLSPDVNWAALDGSGSISFDHRLLASGGCPVVIPRRLRISGPGGSAEWSGTIPSGFEWDSFTVPIQESAWTITSGSWATMLQSVVEFQVSIETVDNGGCGGQDIEALDNIVIDAGGAIGDAALSWGSIKARF